MHEETKNDVPSFSSMGVIGWMGCRLAQMYAWSGQARLVQALVCVFGLLHCSFWPAQDCDWMPALETGPHYGMQDELDWLLA